MMIKRDLIVGGAFLLVGAVGSYAYAGTQKVTICHATHSSTNPYVLITVPVQALGGHDYAGDFIPPVGATDCTKTPPPGPGGGTL